MCVTPAERTGDDDRYAERKRDVTAVGVTAEREVEVVGFRVEEAVGRMHQEDARRRIARERRVGVGRAGPRLVETDDRDVIERWRECHRFVHEHTHARVLERADDAAIVGPEIVVPHDRECSERRRETRKVRRERVDVLGVEQDEVAAEEDDVGRRGGERVAGGGELPLVRRRAGVKIRREGDRQRRRRCAPRRARHVVVNHAHAALPPKRVREVRGPRAGERAGEQSLQRGPALREARAASAKRHARGTRGVASAYRISKSSDALYSLPIPSRLSPGMIRDLVGTLGAWIIYGLIGLFGRRCAPAEVPWLVGPLGGKRVGDRPYEETAVAEGLEVVRNAKEGGLVPRFDALASASFDPGRVHPKIRDFYERTTAYRLDTWATTHFPARLALWLLVTTISRRVEQLNFPLDGLDTAHGMSSEIILLRKPGGELRYTGWFRKLARGGHVIYTGFYMTETPPLGDGRYVKVVFPMPEGNATVILKPSNDGEAGLRLASIGRGFGDAGFYRMQRAGSMLRVWRIASLHETFRLWVDDDGRARCEHGVRFLGFRVLTLHYRMMPA